VWLWRNPQGPLHVLVGSSREVLEAARQRASESPDNQVVIIGRRAELLRHASEDEYDRLRCAIVSGPFRMSGLVKMGCLFGAGERELD
jgi:hypothetical protein